MSSRKKTARMSNQRESLKSLQHTATDESLVGRPSKKLKKELSLEVPVETKKKNVSNKETQANFSNIVTVDDLTKHDEPSEHYYKALAEKRLTDTLEFSEEIKKLYKIINDLKEENRKYKLMLDEAQTTIEVFHELIENDENDTGIDVNDISNTDEAEEHDQNSSETGDVTNDK